MRSSFTILCGAGLALALVACAKTTEPSELGTNTNWLSTCSSDEDCRDGASCLCGVCTRECSTSAACGDVHPDATCERTTASACGGATTATSVCLQGCREHADCTAIEDGRCVSGLCVPNSSPSAECVVHADCGNSPIAMEQGRCAPEVACIDGVCDAWCPGDLCTTTDPNVDACDEPGWICADPQVPGSTLPACRATDITCQTVDQCPKYEPSDDGIWVCVDGYCRFPGFHYRYENAHDDPFALMQAGDAIEIGEAYTACTAHADCLLFENTCGCCRYGAINRGLAAVYETSLARVCLDQEQAACDCAEPDVAPRCEAGGCTAVPLDMIECYEPEDDDDAYLPGAFGCDCAQYATKMICTGAAALICEQGEAGYQWRAVEDGPCGEPTPDPTCSEGTVRATATECLDDFGRCWRLPGGDYCGVVVTIDP